MNQTEINELSSDFAQAVAESLAGKLKLTPEEQETARAAAESNFLYIVSPILKSLKEEE